MSYSRGIFAAFAATLCAAPLHAAATIKFATLAPDGTDAMRIMKLIDADLRAATGGQLQFKFYAGGRQGDERDMVRKIRVGQLHAGGFTGVGLGEIAPEVRVLDGPWLFRNYEEVDFIYDAFSKDFEKAFEAKDYVLLGWTEVGFIHLFSNSPVGAAEDFKKLKLWVWEGDPIAEAALEAIHVHPKPLPITDVNTSLQTGLIDSVYTSPLYGIALQWHEKTKFIFALPFANASGAVLVSKKLFDGLEADQKKALLEVSRKHLKTFNALTRAENEKALKTLEKQGLRITQTASASAEAVFAAAGRSARRKLVGRLYSRELLERVESALEKFRAEKTAKNKK